MKFADKKDLIKLYADSRAILHEDEVEDLLEAFIEYALKELHDVEDKGVFCYLVDGFGEIYEPTFDTRNLIVSKGSYKREKAERMMHEWILNGIVRPKKIPLQNDKLHRI